MLRGRKERGKNRLMLLHDLLMVKIFIIFDGGRTFIRYVAKELVKHPTFKSDLVVGMDRSDYSVLFAVPRLQAIECYTRLLQSFSSRGCLAREWRNVRRDVYVDFVDDLHQVCSESLVAGPATDDMVAFQSKCLHLDKKEYTQYNFKLCCLCLGYVCPSLPSVPLHDVWARMTCLLLSSHCKVIICQANWKVTFYWA